MRNILNFFATLFGRAIPKIDMVQKCTKMCDKNWWQTASVETINTTINSADLGAYCEHGATPLHFAAWWGTSENIATLLKANVDVEVHVDEYGETPLHFAAGLGAPESVTLLLKAGANGSLKDKDGNTPFDLAEENSKMKGTDAYWLLNDARYK